MKSKSPYFFKVKKNLVRKGAKRKIRLLLFAIIFSAPIGAWAEIVSSGICGRSNNVGGKKSVTWSLENNGLLLISGSGAMDSYDDDDAPWCDYNGLIRKVIIENGVTTIGINAFSWCTSLEEVSVSNSIEWIGSGAFDYTPWYTNLPDGMVYVGNVLYKYKGVMPSNTIVDVREGTKSISSWAFNNCSGLVAVNLPNTISKIETGVFRNTSLNKVLIPNSVGSIGEDAFYGCSLLDSVIIGDGVKSIGGYAFYNCSLRSVIFGRNVSWIAEYAFAHNTSLVSIVLGNNIEGIGDYAFYKCSSLEFITIPQAMKRIYTKAFYECSSLTDVFYLGTEEQWGNIQISDYNNVLNAATKHFCIDISEDVSVIGLSESYIYTGSEIKPDIKVLYDEEELVLGIDYGIAYVDNVQVGTATLIVKFCGKYVGEVTLKFDIVEETTTLMEYIDSNERVILYNLQGHRILNHEKGLFIKNGRKILIK